MRVVDGTLPSGRRPIGGTVPISQEVMTLRAILFSLAMFAVVVGMPQDAAAQPAGAEAGSPAQSGKSVDSPRFHGW